MFGIGDGVGPWLALPVIVFVPLLSIDPPEVTAKPVLFCTIVHSFNRATDPTFETEMPVELFDMMQSSITAFETLVTPDTLTPVPFELSVELRNVNRDPLPAYIPIPQFLILAFSMSAYTFPAVVLARIPESPQFCIVQLLIVT